MQNRNSSNWKVFPPSCWLFFFPSRCLNAHRKIHQPSRLPRLELSQDSLHQQNNLSMKDLSIEANRKWMEMNGNKMHFQLHLQVCRNLGFSRLRERKFSHCTAHLKTFGTGTGLVFWIHGQSTRLKLVSHLPSAGVLFEDMPWLFMFLDSRSWKSENKPFLIEMIENTSTMRWYSQLSWWIMAETLLPYMNAIWGYTGSAIEKNTRNGRFCFQKNEGKPSSILGDASGNNRSEKPSEDGFLCILLHLIPESHDVSSKKPTVLELAAGGSSAKKAAGGSLDICPRSAVLQSMTSNKKRGTLVTFPETPGISLQHPISPVHQVHHEIGLFTCSCDLDFSPLRRCMETHPCESTHQPHGAVAWRWTSAYPPSPEKQIQGSLSQGWEFKTQTRKRIRYFQVEDWSAKIILEDEFDFNKAVALPGSGSHVQWSNTLDSTLRLAQPKRQTLSCNRIPSSELIFMLLILPSN